MGSYRFKWPHTADKVIVTGTFDGWGQKFELENKGKFHEKVIPLSATKDKILYKYIVNGQWRTDPSHAVEKDHEGNENNVLDPEDIIYSTAIMNSVGPDATTTGLAGATDREPAPPGAFPDEDAAAIPKGTLQDTVVGVNPIPVTGGSSIQDGVKLDKDSYERGAGGAAYSPVEKGGDPSSASFGRPAAGGTFIPESSSFMNDSTDVTNNNVSSVGPGATTTALAGQQPIEPRGTPQVIRKEDDKDGDLTTPAIIGGGVLAAGGAAGAAIASVGPGSTSTELAGQQPTEPRGEAQVVSKDAGEGSGLTFASGNKDGEVTAPYIPQDNTVSTGTEGGVTSVGPEATTTGLAGQQPIEPRGEPTVTSKDGGETSGLTLAAGVAAGGVVAAGGAAVAATQLGGDKATDAERATTTTVPQEVTDSQKAAGESPEAAANAEAVQEKSEAEKELLSKVPESEAKGEPAPTDSAATATRVPTATSETGAPQLGDPTGGGLAPITLDDKTPAAAADNKPTIATREALQGDSLPGTAIAPSTPAAKAPLNASAESPAQPTTSTLATPNVAQTAATTAADRHRDVSPGTTGHPEVTSGVAESKAPQTSTPETKQSINKQLSSYGNTPGSSSSPSTPNSKKEKRRSFFGRIKDKLKS